MVRIPARCDDCFNRAVADVERNCNGCVADVQAQIEECRSEVYHGCTRERGNMLRWERMCLRGEIKDFKRRRDSDIAELHEKQGV